MSKVFLKILIRLELIALLANSLGALLNFLFFYVLLPFDISNINDSLSPLNTLTIVIFSVVLVKFFTNIQLRKYKNVFKKQSNDWDIKDKNLVQSFFIKAQRVYFFESLGIWFIISVFINIYALIYESNMDFNLILIRFTLIFLFSGTISSLITFFIIENYLIKKYNLFLSDKKLSINYDDKFGINFKIIMAIWSIGILPLLFYILITFYNIDLITNSSFINGKSPNLVEFHIYKLKIIGILIIIMAVFLALIFSIFIFKGINNPLIALKKDMLKVSEGNFNVKEKIVTFDEIGALNSYFNYMVSGLKEREKIKDIFGKYVSPSLRDEILNSNVELGGEIKKVTILFCDIRDFTSISEDIEPKEVVEILNKYFNEIVESITKYNGIIDKFIGDGVMAFFGTPINDINHETNAVKASLDIRHRIRELNSKFLENGYREISFGIGINTGNTICGNIGSKNRFEYTVIGDTVNVASRIEGLCKEYNSDILISENTYNTLDKELKDKTINLGEISIRGRKKAINVYKIMY